MHIYVYLGQENGNYIAMWSSDPWISIYEFLIRYIRAEVTTPGLGHFKLDPKTLWNMLKGMLDRERKKKKEFWL